MNSHKHQWGRWRSRTIPRCCQAVGLLSHFPNNSDEGVAVCIPHTAWGKHSANGWRSMGTPWWSSCPFFSRCDAVFRQPLPRSMDRTERTNCVASAITHSHSCHLLLGGGGLTFLTNLRSRHLRIFLWITSIVGLNIETQMASLTVLKILPLQWAPSWKAATGYYKSMSNNILFHLG
jgi:hypothetical protein